MVVKNTVRDIFCIESYTQYESAWELIPYKKQNLLLVCSLLQLGVIGDDPADRF